MISKDKFPCSCADIERKNNLIQAFKNKEDVFTAIRPEDILMGESPWSANRMMCSVAIVEYLGQMSQVSAIHENRTRIDLGQVRTSEKMKQSLWGYLRIRYWSSRRREVHPHE